MNKQLRDIKVEQASKCCDHLIMMLTEELGAFYKKKHPKDSIKVIFNTHIKKDLTMVSHVHAINEALKQGNEVNKLIQLMQVIQTVGNYTNTTLPLEMQVYPKTANKAIVMHAMITNLELK